jgi:hypothetical protein
VDGVLAQEIEHRRRNVEATVLRRIIGGGLEPEIGQELLRGVLRARDVVMTGEICGQGLPQNAAATRNTRIPARLL